MLGEMIGIFLLVCLCAGCTKEPHNALPHRFHAGDCLLRGADWAERYQQDERWNRKEYWHLAKVLQVGTRAYRLEVSDIMWSSGPNPITLGNRGKKEATAEFGLIDADYYKVPCP